MPERQQRLWESDREPFGGSAVVKVRLWLLEELDKSIKFARTDPAAGAYGFLFLPRSQISHISKAKNPPEAKLWTCEVSIRAWLARKNNLEEL